MWPVSTAGSRVLGLQGGAGHHLLSLEVTAVSGVGGGKCGAFVLLVHQESHGQERQEVLRMQVPDGPRDSPSVKKGEWAHRRAGPSPGLGPFLSSLIHLGHGADLGNILCGTISQRGHMRKEPLQRRCPPCEQRVPILGGSILNQPAVPAHRAHPHPTPEGSQS